MELIIILIVYSVIWQCKKLFQQKNKNGLSDSPNASVLNDIDGYDNSAQEHFENMEQTSNMSVQYEEKGRNQSKEKANSFRQEQARRIQERIKIIEARQKQAPSLVTTSEKNRNRTSLIENNRDLNNLPLHTKTKSVKKREILDHSQASLRQAVIWKEVLDKPVSLRK